MLIDDKGFELGVPTREEMIRHQVVLLKHEREDVWLRLAKANEDIQRLIEINERLNRQIIDLRRQLNEANVVGVSTDCQGMHPGSVPTWGMKMPSTEEVLAAIAESAETLRNPP
ncbi:hypothetical protein [Pseudomonas sp. Irchel 3E13]|uniref:hypothetical protein n=1 Tax=Pseudomonas sp. Irchel 3E13 TaxID=2008975 RepID=UPI000BA319B9|nr:hypothetical protein [Pseudomonas sp. Irchel 3E13]